MSKTNPPKQRYPVFIPSKGRAATPYTIRGLETIGVDFKVVVERQEYAAYRSILPASKILTLPHRDAGLTVTRNWIWDHAADLQAERFWTFDDNIGRSFKPGAVSILRFNRNLFIPCATDAPLRVIEDFADRYKNLTIAGMNYEMFVLRRDGSIGQPPIRFNTRVYSNMLIQTDARNPDGSPLRNVTFYNDDTDLCLRVLKAGCCTALFNAFVIHKVPTMSVKGGMTTYYRKTNDRREFAEELQRAHPDVVKVVRRWDRWHHLVDYRPFKANRLIRKDGLEPPAAAVDDYGMKIVLASPKRRR